MEIARYIDHTLLKADAMPAQIERLCAEARTYSFATVCVNPLYVPLAARLLAGSDSAVCTVVGFPLGTTTSEVKVFEARQAIASGATEIDMVLAIGLLKAGELDAVGKDIRRVVETCHAANAICKVIIETALLSDDEKIAASQLVVEAGADFVKTSTGFSTAGATVADIILMKRTVGERARIKAAGGVRTLADALAMIEAGASRIGTSGGVALVQAARGEADSASGEAY